MKRMIGFIFFWMAIGMLISLFIESVWFEILLIALLLIIGYNLFC